MKNPIKIDEFEYKNRRFIIAKINDVFLAIENININKDGSLVKPLNGIQVFASKNIEDTKQKARVHIDVDEMVENGEDRTVAIFIAGGISKEKAVELANKYKEATENND